MLTWSKKCFANNIFAIILQMFLTFVNNNYVSWVTTMLDMANFWTSLVYCYIAWANHSPIKYIWTILVFMSSDSPTPNAYQDPVVHGKIPFGHFLYINIQNSGPYRGFFGHKTTWTPSMHEIANKCFANACHLWKNKNFRLKMSHVSAGPPPFPIFLIFSYVLQFLLHLGGS